MEYIILLYGGLDTIKNTLIYYIIIRVIMYSNVPALGENIFFFLIFVYCTNSLHFSITMGYKFIHNFKLIFKEVFYLFFMTLKIIKSNQKNFAFYYNTVFTYRYTLLL